MKINKAWGESGLQVCMSVCLRVCMSASNDLMSAESSFTSFNKTIPAAENSARRRNISQEIAKTVSKKLLIWTAQLYNHQV